MIKVLKNICKKVWSNKAFLLLLLWPLFYISVVIWDSFLVWHSEPCAHCVVYGVSREEYVTQRILLVCFNILFSLSGSVLYYRKHVKLAFGLLLLSWLLIFGEIRYYTSFF